MRGGTCAPDVGLIAVVGTAIAVAAGVLTGRAIWAQPTPAVAATPLPALYIADDKHDLGEVWESRDAVLSVPISNRSDCDVEILDFESSCDCGQITPRQLTIPAHGSAEVQIKMDLTRRNENQIGMVRRKSVLTIQPLLRSSGNNHLQFQWITRSAATFNRLNIQFGRQEIVADKVPMRTLVVTSHTGLSILHVETASHKVEARLKETSPGVWTIEITPTSKAVGCWSDHLSVQWKCKSHNILCFSIINVSGVVLP